MNVFYGLIKNGLVIDHIDSCPLNNKLEDLQAVTQSENTKKGLTDKNSKHPKRVKSVDLETNEEKLFHSMNEAEKYFDICRASIRFVAEGILSNGSLKKDRTANQVFIYGFRLISIENVETHIIIYYYNNHVSFHKLDRMK